MRPHTPRLTSVFGTGFRLVRLIRSESGRQVWQARDHRGRRLTLIRARSLRAAKQVRREIALLRALGAADVPAVPAFKWRGLAAYAVAEGADALAPLRGKRAARGMSTKGSNTVAEMASDLAALLGSLHARNLTLGLTGLRGLELSPHGRVVVTDFSHVAPLTPVKRRSDEQWLARLTNGAGTYRYAERKAEARKKKEREANVAAPGAVSGTTSGLAKNGVHASRGRKGRSRRNHTRPFVSLPVKLVAVAALACTVLVGGSMLNSAPEPVPPDFAAEPVQRDDPAASITTLAAARHRYLVGETDRNVSAAPGSEAELADRKLRSALEGVKVEGGKVRVLEVRTLEQSANAARVRVRLKDEGARMGEAAHARDLVQSAPYEIDMRLERVGGKWRIASTTPVEEARGSA